MYTHKLVDIFECTSISFLKVRKSTNNLLCMNPIYIIVCSFLNIGWGEKEAQGKGSFKLEGSQHELRFRSWGSVLVGPAC